MGKARSKRNSRRRTRTKEENDHADDSNNDTQQQQQNQEPDQPDQTDAPAFYMDDQPEQQDLVMTTQDLHDKYHFQAAHYGELEEDMVGYFKGIEAKLDDQDFDSAEDQRLFVENVYSEVEGNELRLATNYSCSLILEKMLKISDHFQLRVFMDKLAGQTIPLFAHRFASHVCQTLLTLAAHVVDQEVAEGVSATERSKPGELPSMQQMILDMCQDIRPMIGGLITQQFASHVVRILLFVLSGKRVDETHGQAKGKLRTKKSSQYKTSKNDSLASVGKDRRSLRVPAAFLDMFRTLTNDLAVKSEDSVIRSLSAHKVASPVLQLLLEMQGKDAEGKKVQAILVDRLLWGFVTDPNPGADSPTSSRNAWFQTLVRDTVASHLLEVIVKVVSDDVYDKLYKTYFAGRLEKFGMNPVSNFVIQQLISHARTPAQLKAMVDELPAKAFKNFIVGGKHGVVRSIVESSANLQACQKQVIDTLLEALGLKEDPKQTVDCLMRMRTLDGWNNMTDEDKYNLRLFHIQGSLIVQAIMKMPAEQNSVVVNSFLSLPRQTSLRWCYTPVGSRAYQAIVSSESVSEKIKKKLLKDLQGDYVRLSKDKFGSHIVEACWGVADINMKEKIAQELVKYEHDLSEHHLGKCILWTCKIDLYKRRHDDWVEREKGIDRKRDMFKDILGSDKKRSRS